MGSRSGRAKALVCLGRFESEAISLPDGKAMFESSDPAFERTAEALTARGHSIIGKFATSAAKKESAGIFSPESATNWRLSDVGFVTAFAAECALRLAQQSCECIEAQASPVTTMAGGFGEAISVAVAALTIFSQPSRQPAPAIQKATASASEIRTILIEERNLIVPASLNCIHLDVESLNNVTRECSANVKPSN